jgi:hypothetical protein
MFGAFVENRVTNKYVWQCGCQGRWLRARLAYHKTDIEAIVAVANALYSASEDDISYL